MSKIIIYDIKIFFTFLVFFFVSLIDAAAMRSKLSTHQRDTKLFFDTMANTLNIVSITLHTLPPYVGGKEGDLV